MLAVAYPCCSKAWCCSTLQTMLALYSQSRCSALCSSSASCLLFGCSGAMPRRCGSTAVAVQKWLMCMDWTTRHQYWARVKRNPRWRTVEASIRKSMSPCDLLDGEDKGIMMPEGMVFHCRTWTASRCARRG